MLGLIQDWPLRLHRILDYAATQFPDRTVVSRRPDGSLDGIGYGDLRRRALQVAERLRGAGIVRGDRVATLAWNSASHLEAWFGIAGAGAIYHTVNPRLFPDQVAWIIDHARPRLLITEAMFLPLVERLIGRLSFLERVIVLGDVPPAPPAGLPGLVAYEDWLAEAGPGGGWTEGDEREAVGLCYTSGTTGEPKGVLYSHRSSVLHALSIAGLNAMAIGAGDVVMPVVPMFHVNAWGIPFAAALTGAGLVMPGARLDGASLYELMETQGVTLTAGVPTLWMGLLDHLRRHGLRLTSLRHLVVGGAACPRSLIEAFECEYGVAVCHAWGMTEMSPVGSVGSLKPGLGATEATRLAVKAMQGYPPFGVEVKIVDGAGVTQPWDGISSGRLMVKGWAVAKAYFRDDAPILDEAGFFDTGDVAAIDPHGYVRIVDRTKDVIKSGGEWISSIAIENLVAGHPQVAEAAVIGVPHPRWDERPLLVVVGRDGAVPTRADILAFLDGRIARWWMPDALCVVEAMPHTATGKVSKTTLRAMLADGRLATPDWGEPTLP